MNEETIENNRRIKNNSKKYLLKFKYINKIKREFI